MISSQQGTKLELLAQEVNSDSVTVSTLEYLSAKVEHSGVYYCKGEEQTSTNTMEIMIFGKGKSALLFV